ncbi:MAG: nicotinamide mononucleotide transporter [Clostridia bacterium]|nr:nicotinamide mononucleotide transporter [Clostridia bacterium]
MKNFLKQFKWWELTCIGVFLAAVLVFGIVFKSSALVICQSLVGVVTVCCLAKGLVVGSIMGIAHVALYCVISYFNNYFGEIIVSACLTLPSYLISIYTWFKNRSEENRMVVKVSKTPNWKELLLAVGGVAAISVGMFFLLQAFNTANLLLSTFSVGTSILASYMMIRRSELNFVCYIINNFICIAMWLSVMQQADVSYVTVLVNYIVFLFINVYGVVNWLLLKKKQRKTEIAHVDAAGEDETTVQTTAKITGDETAGETKADVASIESKKVEAAAKKQTKHKKEEK